MKVNRREFLRNTGLAAATPLLLSELVACTSSSKSDENKADFTATAATVVAPSINEFGIQLWTVKEDVAKDTKGTLKTLSDYGYKFIESFSHEGPEIFCGMKPKEFKAYLESIGLTIYSSHCDPIYTFDLKREDEFKKLVDTQANLNVHEGDVNNGVIYAWPEYREKKDKEGYVETWLGSVKTINPYNINEVVFVEEMLKELVNVALFDKELDKEIENAGLDIDSDPTTIKDAWYPLCTADTPVNDLLTENPYIKVSEPGNTDAVKRLILLRSFMSIGVSAFENKIPFVSGDKKKK